MEVLGKYLLAVAGLVAGVTLVLYGDPAKAKEWAPLATAVIGAYLAYQQRETQAALRQQDIRAASRTEKIEQIADKVEVVRQDVNSGATQALATQALEAHARGVKETLEALAPTIQSAIANERAAGEAARG